MGAGDEIAATADWLGANRGIVREVASRFLATGRWPTRDDMGRWGLQQDPRRDDVYSKLDAMPRPAGFVDRPDGSVKLRVRSLASVPEADEVLHQFIRCLWLIESRLCSNDPNPTVSFRDLVESLSLSEPIARRVGAVLLGENWMLGSGSGGVDDDWEREVTDHSRFVLDVKSVPGYLAIEAQRLWPAAGQAKPASPATPITVQMPSVDFMELHEKLASRLPALFSDGHHDLAVLEALKSIEVRVRVLACCEAGDIGVPLMRKAFGPDGHLRNPSLEGGEQEAISHLFAGAIGTFKNPVSHRPVDYDNSTHAAEIILLADLLHRLLDREAERLRDFINEVMDPRDADPTLYRELFQVDPPPQPVDENRW